MRRSTCTNFCRRGRWRCACSPRCAWTRPRSCRSCPCLRPLPLGPATCVLRKRLGAAVCSAAPLGSRGAPRVPQTSDAIHCVWVQGRGGGGGFAQQEQEPIRGRPAVRGKRTYGGRPGQGVEEQGTWASRTQNHSEAGYGRPVDRGAWTAQTVKRPRQQPAHPQYANYWAPLTRKWHIQPHSAQPRHTNDWALRT